MEKVDNSIRRPPSYYFELPINHPIAIYVQLLVVVCLNTYARNILYKLLNRHSVCSRAKTTQTLTLQNIVRHPQPRYTAPVFHILHFTLFHGWRKYLLKLEGVLGGTRYGNLIAWNANIITLWYKFLRNDKFSINISIYGNLPDNPSALVTPKCILKLSKLYL